MNDRVFGWVCGECELVSLSVWVSRQLARFYVGVFSTMMCTDSDDCRVCFQFLQSKKRNHVSLCHSRFLDETVWIEDHMSDRFMLMVKSSCVEGDTHTILNAHTNTCRRLSHPPQPSICHHTLLKGLLPALTYAHTHICRWGHARIHHSRNRRTHMDESIMHLRTAHHMSHNS